MTTYTSPNGKISITSQISGGYSTEMTIPSNAKIRNAEFQEVLKDCLIFKQKQKNIAMSVLTSFWWMFNYSIETSRSHVSYGDFSYVEAFIETWQNFMLDLEDKNEELHSILSELKDKQIREIAGE